MAEEKKIWSDADIKILISLYEENPLLWDVRFSNYRNRNKKQETLKLIATKLNTDSNEISRKLHNLGSQFMQEVKKLKIKKSGSGTDEIFISTWPYFSALKFIQRSVDNSDTTDNLVNLLNQPMDDEQIYGDYGASEMRQIKHPANKRKLRRFINEAIMSIADIDSAESNVSSPSSHTSLVPQYDSENSYMLNISIINIT
ncbi:hypothetical protein ILUMI_04856 [Ignelater luminosus]|uniref:MADF domain-containing protein n=1 Tax=Ignelater luminosus TaxID=2038154 RepID=A0A8K0DIW3_IGNLU|nr:hypothetical protein ILUMI_04856 [Ignelater luminosus]